MKHSQNATSFRPTQVSPTAPHRAATRRLRPATWAVLFSCAGLVHCTPGDVSNVPADAGLRPDAKGNDVSPSGSGGSSGAGSGGSATGGQGGGSGGAGGQGGSGGLIGPPPDSTGSGGAVDAAVVLDAPVGTGACNNPAWTFCDDFEKYPLGTVPNGDFYPYERNGDLAERKSGASIATDTERKTSGAQSVKFHVNTTGRALLNTDKPFPMPNNAFYGRMMIYMSTIPTGAVHWDIVSAYGRGGSEDSGTGNYRWGGMFGHTMANYHPGDPAVHVNDSIPKAAQWICYEWKFDGPVRVLEMWMDDYDMTGESHRRINPAGWTAPTPFTTLQIGWDHFQNALQGNDVWIDDLVIDDQRIGCPARP